MALELVSAMFDGMEVSGGEEGTVGYLRWLCRGHPRLVLALMRKILPTRGDYDLRVQQLEERLGERRKEIGELISKSNRGAGQ
ncbi:hypothetical protein [Bradyrhizobium sp. 187]|uniref:hypothetical protein n=1 Tax=Bradyrhizobium sp. 187 TaxID=2782655 RepID=UPI001FFF0338|nr:hypothetical protein [Bradyrhizobium sp. 187]UPJ70866.1 hypothetical protein IVB19_24710 [Bradyrhizobium sp. 187]